MSQPINSVAEGIRVDMVFEPTRPLRKFLKDLPGDLGEAFEAQDVHASIVYAEELAAAGLATHEEDKLGETILDIRKGVRALNLEGREIRVIQNVIRPYKKFFGLEIIDGEDICDQVRGVSAAVVEDKMGIGLGNYLDEYHVSIARRRKTDGRRKPLEYKRNFPQVLTIASFNVGTRAVMQAGEGPTGYSNSNRFLDPGRLYS